MGSVLGDNGVLCCEGVWVVFEMTVVVMSLAVLGMIILYKDYREREVVLCQVMGVWGSWVTVVVMGLSSCTGTTWGES